jgi:hypothetical protein
MWLDVKDHVGTGAVALLLVEQNRGPSNSQNRPTAQFISSARMTTEDGGLTI